MILIPHHCKRESDNRFVCLFSLAQDLCWKFESVSCGWLFIAHYAYYFVALHHFVCPICFNLACPMLPRLCMIGLPGWALLFMPLCELSNGHNSLVAKGKRSLAHASTKSEPPISRPLLRRRIRHYTKGRLGATQLGNTTHRHTQTD